MNHAGKGISMSVCIYTFIIDWSNHIRSNCKHICKVSELESIRRLVGASSQLVDL